MCGSFMVKASLCGPHSYCVSDDWSFEARIDVKDVSSPHYLIRSLNCAYPSVLSEALKLTTSLFLTSCLSRSVKF